MKNRVDIWTLLIVTAVTALIWFWAAAETRGDRSISVRLQFVVADPDDWLVTPPQRTVRIEVQGSRLALDQADRVLRQPVPIEFVPVVGAKTIDILNALRDHDELEATGVRIRSAEPSVVEIDSDRIVRVPARVRATLPGVQTVGEVEVRPAEVTVAMPSRLRERWLGAINVEAFVDRGRLDQLDPGRHHVIDVAVRPADGLPSNGGIQIEPGTVQLAFTMRSRIRETRLDQVRVQLAGPPEDYREFRVDVLDPILRDVTIRGEGDLIRRIESEEVTVVAILHLSNREKEQRIDAKPISYFLALIREPDGASRGVQVEGQIGDSLRPPPIRLDIQRIDRENDG
ncbi:MAG: hypothetical protein EA377_05080 [Phycisphaerales bacterium]|nr:MAG: hypothetical protein EA377_05080 [Phycisphaerales bacterium]